ncbi:hypothetical protein CHS0354_017805 [Potamilus streckersoni]|uniref:DNA repair protein SWI5 homolog n=1 Tax=Potamilus streckersoni TaxID=2493646 RepID=A0AAE0T8V3_9BIVA|nr:hypothetical protein CHS0354_017805 [Potamilus streckersoni]
MSTPYRLTNRAKCKTSGLKNSFKSPLQSRVQCQLSASSSPITGSLDDLKCEIAILQQKVKETQKKIKELEEQGYNVEELQQHIDKLHEYNEIKDVGQMVLGRIAAHEGVRTKDKYENYGLNLDD